MRIINSRDIMETIEMLTAENLDVRTVTMGISLLDCIDPDPDKALSLIHISSPCQAILTIIPVYDIVN